MQGLFITLIGSVIGDQTANSTGGRLDLAEGSGRKAGVQVRGCGGVTSIRSLKKVSPIPSLSGQHAIEIMSPVIAIYSGHDAVGHGMNVI